MQEPVVNLKSSPKAKQNILISVWGAMFPERKGQTMGLVNPVDYAPTKTVQAAFIMLKYLNGAEYCSRMELGSDKIYCFIFKKNNTERLVAWTTGNERKVK